ncbi:MAG: hypothetical protein KF678_07325 [Phycisphaeraceae bacterium]|nr:hypothetical protein [Phycisphaeraceae bacterium]
MIVERSNKGRAAPSPSIREVARELRDDRGESLYELSQRSRVLVVLLRHTGCTFCRQTLAELARARAQIESMGVEIVVVGMSEDAGALRDFGARFGPSGVRWIADPDRRLYAALGIRKGSFAQLFGPRVVVAGLKGLARGLGVGRPSGDPFQMPGTAMIHRGEVVWKHAHRDAAECPDYCELIAAAGST